MLLVALVMVEMLQAVSLMMVVAEEQRGEQMEPVKNGELWESLVEVCGLETLELAGEWQELVEELVYE